MSKWQDNYDKNATKIVIPDGIKSIPVQAFLNYENVEEVVIPESVKFIGSAAFCGCKSLKKVNLPSKLTMLDSYAFSMCESLEEIAIPSSLHYLSGAVFSRCTNLKKINIHDDIDYIDDYALYNCKNLENFNIPKNTKSLGYKALMGCNKLKSIHIPEKLETIEVGALSMIKSLEKITVDENNDKFFSADEDTVLISKDSAIVQYAINNPREEFLVGYYEDYYGDVNVNDTTYPIYSPQVVYNIYDYAFAGAKHLQRLITYSELESIGAYTFFGCYNLKELKVLHAPYGDTFILNIHTLPKNETSIPFENIEFQDGVIGIGERQSNLFKSAKKIKLPNTLEYIGSDVFSKSKYLKELRIPESIKMISPNTFYDNTKLHFKEFDDVVGKNFELLQTKTSSEYYIRMSNRDNIRIFSLKDGTYYVKLDDYDTIRVTKDEINNLSNSSYVMSDKPEDFIRYMFDLIRVSTEQQTIMTTIWLDNRLKNSFENLVNYIDPINSFVNQKKEEIIRNIIDASGVYDEFLFSGMIMSNLKKEEIKKVLENYNTSINRYFRLGKVEDISEIDYNSNFIDRLINYCKILEEYQVYDRILYNPTFFLRVSENNQRLLISNFNKNIKRLIINSNILNDTNNSLSNNMDDLLNFCNALGVFSENEKLSQRITTFITERILSEYLPNGDTNNYRISGDSIHSKLGEFYPRENIDYEFIDFFIENYEKLYEMDNEKSGSICRIYNNFRIISSTSTSHRGSQRHLKVTTKKCEDFFLINHFNNVTEENKEVASLLQKYYSEPYALSIAEMILKQSEIAPRNIFTKVEHDCDGNIVYSYDKKDDLKETNENGFSYDWLPKQDYDNLILGKYCNCCAHILGAGAGIMRASMILDNCQNLVIRNKDNDIIAKMTLYVNKTYGYGVFNTAEVSESYRDEDSLLGIYNAFMRGTKAFLDKYNSNNIMPISIITIGEYRNSISKYLGYGETKVLETPKYSIYGYKVDDKDIGTYDGDSRRKQKVVIKK